MLYDPDTKPVGDKKITLTDKTWFIDENTAILKSLQMLRKKSR